MLDCRSHIDNLSLAAIFLINPGSNCPVKYSVFHKGT
jgi:hypothetical protein